MLVKNISENVIRLESGDIGVGEKGEATFAEFQFLASHKRVEIAGADAVEPTLLSMDDLKKRADDLGISYPYNIGYTKLEAKIKEAGKND